MVTAAGVAHSNRLPVLLLSGDTFVNRRPDPVMQQVEHFGDPSINVNDAFRAVTRYWDRITHPEQIISSLPQAVAVLLDPADCGPAFIALPQDVQEMAWDYPEAFFKPDRPCRSTSARRQGSSGSGARNSQKRQATADHFRRRRALFRRRRCSRRVCSGARHSRCRNHRGQRRAHALSPGPCRPDWHCWLDLGQCSGG